MADTEAAQLKIVSRMPPPPSYYQLYGDESEFVAPEPPVPLEGPYPMFGSFYNTEDILPSLKSEGRTQLYPEHDINRIEELKKLNKSLLFKFLELLEYLIKNPSQYKSKVDDIELILVNMHHLLNSYRSHQARQTLISLMEQQIIRRKQTIQNIDEGLNQSKSILENVLNILDEGSKLPIKENVQLETKEEEKPKPMDLEQTEEQIKVHQTLLMMKAKLDQIPRS